MRNLAKKGLSYLAPIVVSLSFGFLCAFSLLEAQLQLDPVTPFQEGIGSVGNAFYFVILVGVGATILYFLIRSRNRKIISFITGFASATATFMLSLVYSVAIFSALNIDYSDWLILIPSVFMTVLVVLAIFRIHGKLSDVTVLLIGGALGAFLGSSIPTLSTVLILGFLAIYDAYAVYRGPVGKIARSGLEQLRGLSYSFGEVQVGLGDLTFYSMLSGHMLLNFGYVSWVLSTIGILLGCTLSFRMVQKKGIFPGLPFPILFGFIAGLLLLLVP